MSSPGNHFGFLLTVRNHEATPKHTTEEEGGVVVPLEVFQQQSSISRTLLLL